MFGNVAKFAPNGISRSKCIQRPIGASTQKREMDFPAEFLNALIDKATSWRDKCFWLMLATIGIRSSEALNLLITDIDFESQKIYIFDPSGNRALMDEDDPKRQRFKGREMAYTYPIPELKKDLFYAIEQYMKLEYVPYLKSGHKNYLLQYVDSQHRGRPYVDVSDQSVASNFKKAVKAANIPKPLHSENLTLHSLRHMYGVYCVNDYPINPKNNQIGLPLVDVQMMMGHSNISSTAHYARSKRRKLEAKLKASDLEMLGISNEEMKSLPSFNVNFS